ncbi:hypothetical protein [Methylocystis echinoides]|jgi:hypothetical protein|uniref:hypothetical protein n=1 Tax=Methylocystis echinoides TaxID=29468 RepID=UPI003449297A
MDTRAALLLVVLCVVSAAPALAQNERPGDESGDRGGSLSEKLDKGKGVIKPAPGVDPHIVKPAPDLPPQSTPVIPPPAPQAK